MNGEIIKLLEMCKNGTLTVEATEELLDAIYRGEDAPATPPELPWKNDGDIRIVAYLGHTLLSEGPVDPSRPVTVSYDGDPKNVTCTCGDICCGNVYGNVSAKNVSVGGDVYGTVTASEKATVNGVIYDDTYGKVKSSSNGVKVNCENAKASANGVKVNVTTDDLKNLGSSISEMVKHSLDFATDAINSANDKLKKENQKKAQEKVSEASKFNVVNYDNVTDIPDDGALRIAVIKGNSIIKSSSMVDRFTVDLGDYEPADVYCSGSLVCGNIDGNVTAGSITCDHIYAGGVTVGGNITCDDISGDVIAGGNITCDDIAGDISGCQTVTCDEVSGNISDCDRITCDTINGDVTRCQTVVCDSIAGDLRDCTVNMG